MKATAGRWIAFALLCLVAGSAWIGGQFWSSPLALLPRLALEDAFVAAVFAMAALIQRRSSKARTHRDRERFWMVLFWGTILFTLPTLVSADARGDVDQFTSALIYTLVPAVVIVIVGQRSAGFGIQASPLAPVLPAVAGAGGAALLLPFVTPASAAGLSWLGAVVVSAIFCALAAIELNRDLDHDGSSTWTALVAAASSAVAAVAAGPALAQITALRGRDLGFELLSALLIATPTMWLTVWLLPRLSPIALSARYLTVPLVAIIEGLILLHPELTWTTSAGLALMVFGCWQLLALG